ncbi:uncharacterized protein LOC126368265 [Pectinophora gossypiella]|uniref:uncharacterized protein LOC126368265 n=1 Tax=Pectinophora gossypiella TaxID=13191 RepID=UPI00214EBD97|nr:uncharacterized protein LOC126368265 [Pectinophora gossypiella]
MKRNCTHSHGHLIRPPGWSEETTSSQEEETPPPARKILRRLLEDEVQKALRELNEEIPVGAKTKVHHAASLIPEFDPDSDDCTTVTAWLRKIEQLGEIHGWNDNTKAFHLQEKLRGQARKWYNRLDDYNYTWEDWKQMLTRAFPRHRDFGNMLDEMISRKKLPTESMTKYYQDKVAMCFRCKLSDSATVSCIIRGLPPSLQANARAFQCERPEELYEGFLCALDDYQAPSFTTRPLHKDITPRSALDKKNMTVNPDVDPCPRCKKTGHILRNCPHPDLRTCFRCGKQGHIATHCNASSKPSPAEDNVKIVKEIKVLQNYNQIYEKVVKINGVHVKSYLDTGSQVNVLSIHVCQLLNLEITPTSIILKGFTGQHLNSRGKVNFQMEIDGIAVECEAHLTDVDMGNIHLLIGQPIINQNGISLVVSNGIATLKQDDDFIKVIEVIEKPTRFKVVTTCNETIPPGSSIIKVGIINNDDGDDVVTSPRHYELGGASYSIPATLLRGSTGYLKVINNGTQNINWQSSEVLTRADKCDAPPQANAQDIVRTKISELLDAGIIRESESCFASPVILVKKKNGDYRLCLVAADSLRPYKSMMPISDSASSSDEQLETEDLIDLLES